VRELQKGLWHSVARHPQWTRGEHWQPEVSSYAVEDGEWLQLLLRRDDAGHDPAVLADLAVPDEPEFLVGRKSTVVEETGGHRTGVLRAYGGRGLFIYDEAPVPADRGNALAVSGGSANAIVFPSGSGTFTWRTPFE
jgi:hypothetical protein